MKSLYKKLNVIITIFFVLGILFSAVNLYNLPIKLEKISGRVDLTVVKELSPVLNQTNLIVGITLCLGLGLVILTLYLSNHNKKVEKIVDTDMDGVKIEEEDNQEDLTENEDLDNQVKSIQSGLNEIKNTKTKYERILSRLCMKLDASQGIVYSVEKEKNKRFIQLFASFAYHSADSENVRYEFGEGLSGQVAKEGNKVNINNIPEGYITIISGLGASSPSHLAILPIKEKGEVVFVVEIASFHEISSSDEKLIGEALTFNKVAPKPAKKELSDKEAGDQKKKKVSDL